MTQAQKKAEREFPIKEAYIETCFRGRVCTVDITDEVRTAYVKGWEADKWINVKYALPTEADADENGLVQAYRYTTKGTNWPTKIAHIKYKSVSRLKHSHWQPMPLGPLD